MNRCPITYEEIPSGTKYSQRGLKKLSPHLKDLKDFPYTVEEQRREAANRASRMSIQGVQEKLSAMLSIKEEIFKIVDTGGRYILKPQHHLYCGVPENEDLTMKLAATVGLETPTHGMVYCADNTLTYFISRFDRHHKSGKYAVEDFSQLSGKNRDTKYSASMEQVAEVIEKYCTFPTVEKAKLFKLNTFNFLVGNEDAHLKNFSLITTKKNTVTLTPCYDLVNTTVVIKATEQLALTLDGRKNKLKKKHFVDYFGRERLKLTDKVIETSLSDISIQFEAWNTLIDNSFLSSEQRDSYRTVIAERRTLLEL